MPKAKPSPKDVSSSKLVPISLITIMFLGFAAILFQSYFSSDSEGKALFQGPGIPPGQAKKLPQCSDTKDNDNDGKIDFGTATTNDNGCSSATDTNEKGTIVCDNGVDETNDADILADYRLSGGDPGCISITDTSEISGLCDDLIDNDGDGVKDYPNDPGCTGYADNDETNPSSSTQCTDGLDNDNDGRTDYGTGTSNDPGCSSTTDTSEIGSAICDNGVDEATDSDSLADYRLTGGDPGCASVTDTSEISGQCDDKLDNDADTKIDYPADLGCTSYSDNDEYNTPTTYQCSDGKDNDGDGKIDYGTASTNDPGCSSSTDNNETDSPTPTYDEKGCLNNYVEIKPGLGCFVYHDNGNNANRPVRVWYYLPYSNFPNSNSKIIFAMHGSERNAVVARDRLVPYADRYDALIVAPEFSTTYYPDADDYNRGFVKDGGGTGQFRNRNDWTFLTIEEIFDVVRGQFSGAPTKYSIGGNSAAGQFISRLAWIIPEARYETASGSNGGWYTLPIGTSIKPQESYCPDPCKYPNGVDDLLSNGLLTEANINTAYSRNYLVPIGELDTNPNDYDLTHNTFTDAQGLNRYERAHFHHDYRKADAQARGVPYKWHVRDVANTPHDASQMAHVTALAMFENVYTYPHASLSPADDTYIEAANKDRNFGSSTSVYMDGGSSAAQIAYMKFDLTGIQSGDFDVAALKIWVHDNSPDTYSVKAVSSNSWNEETVTWNNAPARSLQEEGSTKGAYGDGYMYIVITDYAKAHANGYISLAIDGGSGTTGDMAFYSKEASDKRPVLEFFSKG